MSLKGFCQVPTVAWQKTIASTGNDTNPYILQTSDGGYIIAGTSDGGISGDKSEASKGGTDYWIVKLDANRNKVWDKTLGGSANEQVSGITASFDGDFIISGISNSPISGNKTQASFGGNDFWIVKIKVHP